jgi:cell division protein FtsI (penicillin-binding protein 3)
LLRPLENWSANSIGSLAMGQEVSVTPIQIISAISAIANGGTLYRPHILRDMRGDLMPVRHVDTAPRQATDQKTAAEMRGMMEDVVLEGTGKPAQLSGYTAAGKSGTAQKIDPSTGRYSATQYNSSFVGFAPVNDPAISILVVLDSPVGAHHGGEVGGPVFKRVAEQVLAYLAVPHDVPAPSDVETAKNLKAAPQSAGVPDTAKANFEEAVARKNQARAPTVAFSGEDAVAVPRMIGQSVRAVTEECGRLGLVPSLVGSGIALEQYPDAGTQVQPGSQVMVRFGRPGMVLSKLSRGDEN